MKLRSLALIGALSLTPTYVLAQSEPDYYAKPEKPADYWKIIQFEVGLGKYDVAAQYLKGLLEKNPSDEDLLALEAKDGMAPFLRLRNITTWVPSNVGDERTRAKNAELNTEAKKNAETLVQKINAAVKAKLGDTKQIAKLARALTADKEEALFAERELFRTGPAAIPVLVELMRAEPGSRDSVRDTISRLDLSTVPAVVAALEIPNPGLQISLLEALRNRSDYMRLAAQVETDPLPILNYFSSNAPGIAPVVRDKANSMREGLAVRDPRDGYSADLAMPQGQLWKFARLLYEHKGRFRETTSVPLWYVNGNDLVSKDGNVSDAEEFYGLKYLRWALKIQPEYQKAQLLFLKLALEKHYARTGLEKPLSESAPRLNDILLGAPYDLLAELLNNSILEQKSGTALAVIQTLGQRVDLRAVATSPATEKGRKPALLERALDHPDFRVQLAAAVAILEIPTKVPVAPDRVVKILAQAVRAGVDAQKGKPTALIGDFDTLRGQALANLVRKVGYEVEWNRTGRDILRRLNSNTNVDLVIVDTGLPYPQMGEFVAQFRADPRFGGIPLVLTHGFEKGQQGNIEHAVRVAGLHRNVTVVNEMLTEEAAKEKIGRAIEANDTPPVAVTEKRTGAKKAIEWLRRISAGEKPGYAIAPAAEAVREAFNDAELAVPAIEAAAGIPNKEVQQDLANVFLNVGLAPELRLKASDSLIRQLQQYGNGLASNQVKAMDELAKTEANAAVKGRLAGVLGVLQSSFALTGGQLEKYFPVINPEVPLPAPKEKQ